MASFEKNETGSPLKSGIYKTSVWLDRITMVGAIIGITMLSLAIIVVVGDIILRRIGGGSFIGAVDLTQLSVVIAASLAIPYAFSRGTHVKVDLLSDFLSQGMKLFLDVSGTLFGAVLLSFLLWLTWGRAMEVWGYGDVSQDLSIPMIFYWGALIAGVFLSILVCLVNTAKLLAFKDTDNAS